MSRVLISCLLALGALTTASAAEADSAGLSLAVPWKAKLVHPLPSAPSNDKAHLDSGISPEATKLVAVDADDQDWETHQVPGQWESYDGAWRTADGEAVFRLSFDLPANFVGRDLELSLGAIDDFDDTYFNGVAVGRTDKSVLGFWALQRVYQVPAQLAKAGRTVIAVRVFDHFGGGGFNGPKEQLVLRLASAPQLVRKAQ